MADRLLSGIPIAIAIAIGCMFFQFVGVPNDWCVAISDYLSLYFQITSSHCIFMQRQVGISCRRLRIFVTSFGNVNAAFVFTPAAHTEFNEFLHLLTSSLTLILPIPKDD